THPHCARRCCRLATLSRPHPCCHCHCPRCCPCRRLRSRHRSTPCPHPRCRYRCRGRGRDRPLSHRVGCHLAPTDEAVVVVVVRRKVGPAY
ncbi:hypothetical protein CVT25_010104, partial [Psilocybe cyanescens]